MHECETWIKICVRARTLPNRPTSWLSLLPTQSSSQFNSIQRRETAIVKQWQQQSAENISQQEIIIEIAAVQKKHTEDNDQCSHIGGTIDIEIDGLRMKAFKMARIRNPGRRMISKSIPCPEREAPEARLNG